MIHSYTICRWFRYQSHELSSKVVYERKKRWRILHEFFRTINLTANEEYAVKEDNAGEDRNPAVVEYRNPGWRYRSRPRSRKMVRTGRGCCRRRRNPRWRSFVTRHQELRDEHERQRAVRNGAKEYRRASAVLLSGIHLQAR